MLALLALMAGGRLAQSSGLRPQARCESEVRPVATARGNEKVRRSSTKRVLEVIFVVTIPPHRVFRTPDRRKPTGKLTDTIPRPTIRKISRQIYFLIDNRKNHRPLG